MKTKINNFILLAPLSVILLNVLRVWQLLYTQGVRIPWQPMSWLASPMKAAEYTCDHTYTIEILSLDPLVMYLNGFVHSYEIEYLLKLGESRFGPSQVIQDEGNTVNTTVRRSQTAFLPAGDVVCNCLAQRMQKLLGNLQHQHVESLQLVKYSTTGDTFRLHTDWMDELRNEILDANGNPRLSRRLGTVLVYLEDECEGGETFFPDITGVSETADEDKFSMVDDGEGLLVRAKRGNGVFWNNLHANGSGDTRVTHAGLPVQSGTKIALNIWSTYFIDSPLVGGHSS